MWYENLETAENGWLEASSFQSLENVKSYMIVIEDNAIKRNRPYKISYDITIPEGVPSNKVTYACHKIFFDLRVSEGLLSTSIQTLAGGIKVVRYYDLMIAKHEKDSDRDFSITIVSCIHIRSAHL